MAYGIALSAWLDLSTGINPRGWPVPALPSRHWLRLPEEGDGLEEAAASFYRGSEPLPVAGSQAAIQALPRLRASLHGMARVGVPHPGFEEHARAWAAAGHQVVCVPECDEPGWQCGRLADERMDERLDALIDHLDVLVLIHPNNPTGRRWSVATLLDWHARLATRGGWLLVDEAFMDMTPEASLAPHAGLPGLIVLRSLGKFFGLAGARVGFVLTSPGLRERLHTELGPWSVPGPSRTVARLALSDRAWQQQTRTRLDKAGRRLRRLLAQHALAPRGGCALFQWVVTAEAERIQQTLARQGVWVRRFPDPPGLRFGLPGKAAHWRLLDAALRVSQGSGRL